MFSSLHFDQHNHNHLCSHSIRCNERVFSDQNRMSSGSGMVDCIEQMQNHYEKWKKEPKVIKILETRFFFSSLLLFLFFIWLYNMCKRKNRFNSFCTCVAFLFLFTIIIIIMYGSNSKAYFVSIRFIVTAICAMLA